ncbi:unnamed protein product [Protopolystoma xenopodis]|uniref:PI3K/PI4K catalytic domain-containing protein n=1 Tax=Protopolystoma xenopodis TaxID=117903 RepID=A0A3S5BZZ1_9PLAT|nr:unnamed protein product [Protopolystoma xenopodis]
MFFSFPQLANSRFSNHWQDQHHSSLINADREANSSCDGIRSKRSNERPGFRNLVTVIGFGLNYCLAGGLNLPKILTCLGSDGRIRRQVIKGRDDPRQDAVMQQVRNWLIGSFE